MIKFGIWGCGLISAFHAEAIAQIDNAKLCGAFDLNKEAELSFCKKYDAKPFDTIDEFLSSGDIDAVCICLPSGLHYEAAMKCIESGKHVVIEKPMTLNSQDAQKIIDKADEKGVCVAVISQLRYTEAVGKVKKIIESGKLGTITIGNAIMKYWRDEDYYKDKPWRGTFKMDGGGALMNQGIHGVDLLQYLMGKVVSVFAFSKTLVHDIEAEDTLTAVVEYENGAIGTIQATTSVNPGYGRRIEIHGSKGSIVLCEDTIEVCDVEGEDKEALSMGKEHASASRPDGIGCEFHALQLEDFVRAVTNGEKPWIDAREGKKAVDIITAIYKSAKSGEKVFL